MLPAVRSFDLQERGSNLLEKLFELLLHAKGGAISAIFVLGATGALVTATTQNGVTTITITQASPSPSVSPATTASPAPNAAPSASAPLALNPLSSSPTLSGSASPSPCAEAAHDRNDAVRLVNRTSSQLHVQLEHLRRDARTDAARSAVVDADRNIREIRKAAVKAIDATFPQSCMKDKDDEDKDNDNDEDKDEHNNEHKRGEHGSKPTVTAPSNTAPSNATPTVTLTGTDPKTIAQLAVTAMKAEFAKAKAAVDAQPAPTPRAKSGDKNDRSTNNKDKKNHSDNDD